MTYPGHDICIWIPIVKISYERRPLKGEKRRNLIIIFIKKFKLCKVWIPKNKICMEVEVKWNIK